MTSDNSLAINAKPRLKINSQIRDDLSLSLLQMRVNQPYTGMANAELRFMNWASNAANAQADFAFQQIAHGDRLEILAAGDDDHAIFVGDVTGIEEIYGHGAPRLVLLVEDDLHKLAKKRTSRVFDSQSPDDVIQAVLSDVGLSGDIQVSSDTGVWHQMNESHLAFLTRLLSPYEIGIRMQNTSVRAKLEEEDSSPVALHTQNQIQSLRVLADLNHQYTEAQTKGFNLEADETTSGSNSNSHASGGTDAKQSLTQLSWSSEEILAQPFSRNQAEASAWAEAAFRKKSSQFLYGDLVCAGDANLRVGKEIDLSGASTRINGKYRILQTQHLFDLTDGYKTRVKISRSFWNNNSSANSSASSH